VRENHKHSHPESSRITQSFITEALLGDHKIADTKKKRSWGPGLIGAWVYFFFVKCLKISQRNFNYRFHPQYLRLDIVDLVIAVVGHRKILERQNIRESRNLQDSQVEEVFFLYLQTFWFNCASFQRGNCYISAHVLGVSKNINSLSLFIWICSHTRSAVGAASVQILWAKLYLRESDKKQFLLFVILFPAAPPTHLKAIVGIAIVAEHKTFFELQ
jgi:hypothetical protein